MPAFSRNTMGAIGQAAHALFARTRILADPVRLTHAEFEELFILPEHFDINRQLRAMKINPNAQQDASNASIGYWREELPARVSKVEMRVAFIGNYDGILPSYIRSGWQAEHPLAERINAGMRKLVNLHVERSLAQQTLERIIEACDTPQAVRFFISALPSLMKVRPELLPLATSIESRPIPGKLPSLSPELRDDCALTNQLISKCLMLEPGSSPTFRAGDVLVLPDYITYTAGWMKYNRRISV